jgi:pimeloyl-ACP methyl ester carboxylesterase
MLLFIHDAGASSSSWLPQIKGLLNIIDGQSDYLLRDVFTLSLSGHLTKDAHFDWESLFDTIDTFVEENGQKQQSLAQNLYFKGNSHFVRRLKHKKLTIIGHSFGGAIALKYALKRPQAIHEIVLVGCGNSFSLWQKFVIFWFKHFIFKLNKKTLQFLQYWYKPNLRNSTFFNIISDSSEQRGLSSAYTLMSRFNFKTDFEKLSLEEQLKFLKLPILTIQGGRDILTTNISVKKLSQTLDVEAPIFQIKRTLINTGDKTYKQFTRITYPLSGHNPMEDNINRLVTDVQNFLSLRQ